MPEFESIEQELENEINPLPAEQTETPSEEAPKELKAEPEGTPKEEVVDDPEMELKDKDGNPRKVKLSQIQEWEKGSMLQSDYTKKTQEIAAQREELKEMQNVVEHLKTNPKKAERIIAILNEQEKELKEQKDEIDEDLKDLPEDDPYTKALRSQKAQLKKLAESNQLLQQKLEGYETQSKSTEQQQVAAQAKQVLDKTLGDVGSKLEFTDDEEKADWRERVLAYLINHPGEYKTEEEFVNTITTIGGKYHTAMQKLGEKHIKKYLSKKTPAVPSSSVSGAGKPLKEKPDFDNLDALLVDALKEESDSNT